MTGGKQEVPLSCMFLAKNNACGCPTVEKYNVAVKAREKDLGICYSPNVDFSNQMLAEENARKISWIITQMETRSDANDLPSIENGGKCLGGDLTKCTCYQAMGPGCGMLFKR